MSIEESCLFLDDIWVLYHHDINDDDWTFESYHNICCISSAEEFWTMHDSVTKPYIGNGMFFLTREHVFPCWDDPHNINGGCISVKVAIDKAADYWCALACTVLCESSSSSIQVNAISCSPRNFFCIFKVWVAETISNDAVISMPPGYIGVPMFKSNKDNISNNNQKNVAQSPKITEKNI